MNIKTFLQCVKMLKADKSVLIRGDHGIGKSQIVRQVANFFRCSQSGKPLKVIDRRMSQMTEGDMIGLPKIENDMTRFMAMDWFMEACRQPCMLFLDEGNRATGEVLQAAFQIVLDRELNGNKLHPETRVFMAINSDESKYQVTQFDPALLDRFWVSDLTPTVDEWLEWAKDTSPQGGNIHQHIVNFIEMCPTALDPAPGISLSEKTGSRRSWDRFSETYVDNKLCDLDLKADEASRTVLMQLANGFVGHVLANGFVDYVKSLERYVTAEDILERYQENVGRIKKLAQHEMNLVNNHIVDWLRANTLDKERAENLGEWFKFLPGELVAGLWQEIAKYPQQTTTNLKLMHPYIQGTLVGAINKKK